MTERLPPFPGWRCHVNGHVWMKRAALTVVVVVVAVTIDRLHVDGDDE